MAYSLVLVDDEDWILMGLQNAVEWESIGFSVTGAFTNGKDALDFMIKNPPDAVLTDIKMPIQDGISLVRQLREAGMSDLEVVFLSGYDDFVLVQSSLRLRAVDYVLKPSSPEQILEIFSLIRRRLDEKKKAEEEKQAASQMARAGVRVLREAIYNSIISDNRPLYQRLTHLYEQLVTKESKESYWIISAALEHTIKGCCPDETDIKALEKLKVLAKELAGEQEKQIDLIKNPYFFSFVVSGCSEDEGIYLLQSVLRQVQRDTGCRIVLSKSFKIQDFSRVWENYEHSLGQLLGLDFPAEPLSLCLGVGNDTVLRAAVQDRDQQILLWCLKNWMLKIDRMEEQYRLRLLKYLIYSFSVFLLQSGFSKQRILPLFEGLSENGEETAIYEKGKADIISFIKAELTVSKGENYRNLHLCRQVASYISKNYNDEITLNDLAERFYISPNYMGSLFKKNMGMSIREYQTMIRLEQADLLIQSGKFKLYQVAEMVGYPNYEYFRKTYGKYRGKNPSE